MLFFSKKNSTKKIEDAKQVAKLEVIIEELTIAVNALKECIQDLGHSNLETQKPKISKAKKPLSSGLSVAIIGVRGHGQKHINNFLKLKGCHISYICDVDTRIGKLAVEKIYTATGHKPKFMQDIRDLLKDKSVDIVSISTPHHWHALATVWALQAGKHVYIEKPITHAFSEGPSVIAAAKKYGKIIQSGTQLRSNTSLAAAGEYMRAGKLGKIEVVHCITYKDRPPLPVKDENKVPKSVDYNLWCGPGEQSELARSKFHYHWHWFWNYGNGALGNNGIHRIDAARIALGLEGFGDLVLSYGGRFGPSDKGETPNTQITMHKFGNIWILQDAMGMAPKPFKGIENGLFFHGSKGTILYTKGYAALIDEDGNEIKRFEGKQLNHYYNFLEAVRANDQSVARGDLRQGILSGDLCHLGNISYRVGKAKKDSEIAKLVESIDAPKLIQDRLAAVRVNMKDNDVHDDIILGDVLYLQNTQDPIIDNPAASSLLQASYRDPFVLPSPADV